ncbi:hypothetical protein NDU88_000160 [Pleurodeles waltl]|uniref:Uncharacterized protein n=1 Tax=Pleurodeles waltl TaxID=8319 RepID=A0AAV7VWR7_PLEWA|nr:hypothetical protein NDU88_000160 [Pleurodeles waltl]
MHTQYSDGPAHPTLPMGPAETPSLLTGWAFPVASSYHAVAQPALRYRTVFPLTSVMLPGVSGTEQQGVGARTQSRTQPQPRGPRQGPPPGRVPPQACIEAQPCHLPASATLTPRRP